MKFYWNTPRFHFLMVQHCFYATQCSWIAVTGTTRGATLKIFTTWPFTQRLLFFFFPFTESLAVLVIKSEEGWGPGLCLHRKKPTVTGGKSHISHGCRCPRGHSQAAVLPGSTADSHPAPTHKSAALRDGYWVLQALLPPECSIGLWKTTTTWGLDMAGPSELLRSEIYLFLPSATLATNALRTVSHWLFAP